MTTSPRFDASAALVQRLSVLLEAGIAPLSAWRHAVVGLGVATADGVIAGVESAHEIAGRLAAAARAAPLEERSAWQAIAVAWMVATEAGAPLAPALARLAEVLRGLSQASRDIEVALAGPVSTSRVVLGLPVVGLALGGLMGFDVVGSFATLPGLVCLVAGATLVAAGVRWNRRLVRAARDLDATPGLWLELFAVALSGGASMERARSLVDEAGSQVGIAPDPTTEAVLTFATTAGVPVVALLRSEAEERRRDARSAGARAAALLETRLLFPLGLCILPAFVLLGVAPIAIAIVSSTATGL